jgi:hypothetical protein
MSPLSLQQNEQNIRAVVAEIPPAHIEPVVPVVVRQVNPLVVIEELMLIYANEDYTEEMYQDQTQRMFGVLHDHYDMESPEDLIMQVNGVRRANSFREVLRIYAETIPMFELDGFGV